MTIGRLAALRRRRRLGLVVGTSVLALQALGISRVLCTPQAFERFYRCHVLCPPRAWPFLDYPMFNDGHSVGERLERRVLHAVARDGRVVTLYPEELAQRDEMEAAVAAVQSGDRSAVARAMAPRIERDALARVDLCREPLVLERDGFRGQALEVQHVVSFDSSPTR
jgi:hypothetical protein